MTRLDMVKMLRESLVSGLQFLVDPRVALLLLAVAFVVLWESNHTRKSAKPALADLADEPGAKRYSVFGVTATPFFLALVCGVSLVAVGWRSASREQLTHLSASTPISSLSMQHDTSPSVKKRPARVPALSGGQPSSSGEAEPLVSSLPPLTPEIDQPDQRATMTGNENQLTANPSGLGAVASHNSPSEHWGLTSAQDSPSANAVRKKTLDRIEQARRDKNWRLMATLSEDAIAQSPQWLTPYELAGEAYVQTGDIDRAIARLEYVKMSGAGGLGDGWAVVEGARLRESIRHRYGR
ncbi:MAG TPA: hypothetical protein VG204_06770 [Terriglobia bacterium]|nr:hypothetical protein [Terriglobia bacterium]